MLAAGSRQPYDQIVRTVCGACPAGCGVKFYVQDGRVVDLLGDEAHPVNRGTLCARGSAFFQHFDHPARLQQPALRHALDQDFAPSGWEEALDFAAGRLKAVIEAHGPASIAVVTADSLDVGDRIGAARCAARLGARLMNPVPAAPDVVATEMFGASAAPRLTVPPDEWARSGCLLVLGGDPAVEYPIAFRHVLEARARQIPVIAVAPRYTATLSKADYGFQIRPGSEAVFLLGLAKVAFEEGLPYETRLTNPGGSRNAPAGLPNPAEYGGSDNTPRADRNVPGMAEWRAAAGDLSWGTIERLTWLPEASVRRAGLVWAAHQPGLIVGGGVVSPNLARAAAGLLALAGNSPFSRAAGEGGGWNWLAEPPWPFLLDGNVSSGASEPAPIKAIVGTGNFWPLLETAGLAEVEFVAHFGAYPDEAQRRAHVSLPAVSWAEVEGLHIGYDRRIQRHVPVIAPPGQARAALEFWAALADRLDLGEAFPWRAPDERLDFRDFAESLLAESPATAGLSLDQLDVGDGVRWPHQPPSEAETAGAISLGPPPEVAVPEFSPGRPFLLCRDVPAEGDAAWWPWLDGGEDVPVFCLNPVVAAALGIENGDALIVDDGRRHHQGRARLTSGVDTRTIWASGGRPKISPVLVYRQSDNFQRALGRLRGLVEEIRTEKVHSRDAQDDLPPVR